MNITRSFHLTLMLTAAVITLSAQTTFASMTGIIAGTHQSGIGTSPETAVPFLLDYTTSGFDFDSVIDIAHSSITFQSSGFTFETMHILLADGTDFAFDAYYLSTINGEIYNPTYYNPGDPNVFFSGSNVMNQSWINEITDGQLDASLWLENVGPYGVQSWNLSSNTTFVIPEPATMSLLALGAAGMLLRKK